MRALLLAALFVFSTGAYAGGRGLRRIDFKNLEYPWNHAPDWSEQMGWLDLSESNRAHLVNGRWPALNHDIQEGGEPFSGLTFESVQFGDVTRDGQEEAIVVLRFDTGGTQYSHYVFIYSSQAGQPRLIAYFHSGDRAYSGLYRVYAHAGKLVVELFNPEMRSGDCCSSGFIRTRYSWRHGTFVQSGPVAFGTPRVHSRIPVSVFGNHK
jgi:hypothetical protein